MKNCLLILIAFFFIIDLLHSQTKKEETQITWDTWGVPHISSQNIKDLFFAQGWAQMHNHANIITELYGSSRGKGAEYWGESKLQNDILIHTLYFDQLANEWENIQDSELKTINSSFINGMNAYVQAHPESIDEKNKIVLPLTTKDLNMHVLYLVFTRFIGGYELGRIQQWPNMGSNTFAISPKNSASGNAMLVQNPHLPWHEEFLLFESHLNLNGKNMYGVNFVGIPGIVIGFNENLGWSHTDNTIDNADTYELQLKDDGYVLDGETKEFEKASKIIKIKQDDGTLVNYNISLMKTVHGPVIKKNQNKVLSLRMAGLEQPNMLLEWWRMINSSNFDEFESALKMAQIPFWNIMYADKKGEIFYLYNGLIPKRNSGDWDSWNRIILGGKSKDIWTEVLPYSDLPKIKNPICGWLQNANDPPWTCTIPITLNPNNYPSYIAPQNMFFRPQRATRMMLEDKSISFDELVDYKLSTRLEFADRILDDLFTAIDNSDSEKAKEAKLVLENWDRKANADSKGMLLFYSWAEKFQPFNDSNYTEKWSMEKPNTTPDGIADSERAVRLLEQTVLEVEAKFGSLNTAWGDYFRIRYNGTDLPANGEDGSLGSCRVTWPSDFDKNNMYVGGGDSWVGIIEFGKKVHAKVLLSYGNSTQKNSPHYGDQLELFSKNELRDAWFTKTEVELNTSKIEVLIDNGFQERK